MSVNWSGTHPELRLLFDCDGEAPGGHGLVSLGSALDDRSGAMAAARRPRRLQEIFVSRTDLPSPAPMWYSVAWRPPSKAVHKMYFGLYEWPLPQRYRAVGEAMDLLGMTAAWNDARGRIEAVDGQREIEFFGLDLRDDASARVKIYYRHHGADVGEMNRVASVALHHDAKGASAAYRTLTGDRADAGEAALSCLAFRSGLARVAESTIYLRQAALASCDQEAVDRTATLLRAEGVDPGRFRALVAALAPGPLEDSRGLLELVSHRAAGRRGDITTYFRFPVYERAGSHPISAVDLA